MGRWQTRLATAEKSADTPQTETFKTLKTPAEHVLKVLRVPPLGEYENFSTSDEQPSDADVAAAEWEERAAVLEFDEGLPRDAAERLAAEQAGISKIGGTLPLLYVPNFGSVDSYPANPSTAEVRDVEARSKTRDDSYPLRPAGWLPEPGHGVGILATPAVEVDPEEYDAHLDQLIAEYPSGSAEAAKLAFAKRKGWCVERGAERIFVRGRM
ncbi:hypothetical protein [Aureimonas leprariae]|uniref:Uncharacterized protein n=1 Tax=Plantimonas leprariae TaxID=2615207 RepID=A0A7V7TWQ7_9HYPH|nr:hypothetical protein [Aureimonas leprariae]KAB0680070.1 hypothetical protein F6X38_09680 [Aureimonas leprariae]